MGRRRKRIRTIRHPNFFKYLTIAGATLGILSSTTFAVLMGVDAVKGDFITDEVREYTASFSSEGSLISKTTYKRGEELQIPENPTHELDGENNYFFIGWDTNKNGIPDYVPKRAYYSFDAEAVYFRTGKFDLDFMDLMNMDLEDLMQLLQNLNIDWEQFMSMFNIDPETLAQWLAQQMVLTFETDPAPSSYPTYFRATSFGDFDYSKKSFKAPDFYDSSLISDNSVNPLSYTAYKLNKLDEAGLLPDGFGFTDYDITFNSVEDYYAVPDCESSNNMGEFVDSDAHYLKQPIDNHYQTRAAYCPAFGYVIDLFNAIPLTGTVGRDEKAYYNYAMEHYTSIPKEYEQVIDDMIYENDWYEKELYQVDSIAAYVGKLGACSLFNDDGEVDIGGYINSKAQNKDPVIDLINNKRGSDLDFNTTAVMLFRRLQIPARLVKGYVSVGSDTGTNSISLFNQHYWCEIYVKGTGWMICDCMDTSAILGTNPYEELDKQNTPLENKHVLESITVKKPNKTSYFIGEPLDITGGSVTAHFSDDTDTTMRLNASGVAITGFDTTTVGVKNATVSYTYGEVTKTGKFTYDVKEKDAELINVVFDFSAVKKEYFLDDPFTSEGIVAIGYYDDGTSLNISNAVEIAGDTSYLTQEIANNIEVVAFVSVKDGESVFSDSYYITVMEDTPEDLTILTLPNTVSYFTGEDLIVTGLSVKVTYKSGKTQTLSPTGLAKNISSDILGFSMTSFDTPNEHTVIEIYKWNRDYTQNASTTFEVEVKQNDIQTYESFNFKDDYSVGDYFDANEFKSGGGFFVITMRNGQTVRVSESYASGTDYDIYFKTLYDITAPKLHSPGISNAIVSFTYNDADYHLNVPVTIKDVKTYDFIFSEPSKVSTAGPGSGIIENTSLFTFNTSYAGTMYFRQMSFNTYSPTGWSNSSNTTFTYSPNGFTYDKAQQVYNRYPISIDYVSDVSRGVLPIYSNSQGQENYENAGTLESGSHAEFEFTNFALTAENIQRLESSYISYTGSLPTSVNSYQNQQLNKYRMNGTNDGSDAYQMIEDYINQYDHQYKSYGSKIETVLKVKNDLANEFTYDIDFKYEDSDVDPMVSFFNNKVGISNDFASAATLIYRHLGYEARYVVGFGAYSNGSTPTTVTARNGHAWCEVYFNNIGWITIDPTGLDSGVIRHGTGDYGDGFGGSGLYSGITKIDYGGVINFSYDYSQDSAFVEDTDVPANDPARWYYTYDNKDHHNVYTAELDENTGTLPSFLEWRLYFDWQRNDNIYAGYNAEDVATTAYGQYTLTPYIRVYDKTTGEDVTAEYSYVLSPDTAQMQYYVQPALVYVNVYGTQASYSMNGAGYIYIYAGQNEGIYFNLVVPEDIAALELYDELPTGLTVDMNGYFYYVGEGGTIMITYENLNPYISSYTGVDWDVDNVYLILYCGEVVINP